MPYAAVNGIDLYYESHGEGRPVVFLHGAAGNHLSWWQQIPTFRKQYRCITIDHRGFGSSKDPEQKGATEFVNDLAGLLDHLEIERAALVAQSMGGRTALGFAVRHPERVPALVMADTWGFFDWPEQQERAQAAREAIAGRPLSMTALGEGFQQREPARTFLYRQIMALNPPRPEGVATPAPGSPTVDQVAALQVPVLCIVGSEDVLTPPSVIRPFADLLPNAEYEEFAGAGHSVYFEDGRGFNERVGAFLAKHLGVGD
jgi:3-oxoadipate enol-lactonase